MRALPVILLATWACASVAGAATAREPGQAPARAPSAGESTRPDAPAAELRPATIRPRQPVTRAAIALGGVAVLALAGAASRSPIGRRLRDGALLGLALAGAVLWMEPLRVIEGDRVHLHELYHYYLGAKYFRELGYTRLYECTTVVDLQDGQRRKARRRLLRNLTTNTIEGTQTLLANPRVCTQHFSTERWKQFAYDVRFLRKLRDPDQWERALKDHGYNGTPVWALAGTWLAGTELLTPGKLKSLSRLDPLLLTMTCGFAGWAFGWRPLAVAVIFLACFFPASHQWTAGAFLRYDWLLASVAGICLLRRGAPVLAGVGFAWAALLRLFPALILIGVAAKAIPEVLRGRTLAAARTPLRLAAGFTAAAALLVGLSWLQAGGWDAWRGFADNMRLHLGTPLFNHMGLETVAAYDPDTAAIWSVDSAAPDPTAEWKQARRDTYERRRLLHWAAVAGFVALLVVAVRREPDWSAAALGIGVIPVAAELTCYYYAFLFPYALLAVRRPSAGVLLLLLAAASQLVPLLPGGVDEVYTALSAMTVATVTAVTALFAFGAQDGAIDEVLPRPQRAPGSDRSPGSG